jgi:hypothetical protein
MTAPPSDRQEKMMATAQHIVKSLASYKNADDDMIRILASFKSTVARDEEFTRALASVRSSPRPDRIRHVAIRVELTRAPAASLCERAQQVLDEGSVECLMLVSGHEELPSLLLMTSSFHGSGGSLFLSRQGRGNGREQIKSSRGKGTIDRPCCSIRIIKVG